MFKLISSLTVELLAQITGATPTLLKPYSERVPVQRISVLCLRLIIMMLLVAVLTMHVRSVKVFKWEQSVSGGVLVTYLIADIGLALSAGANSCNGTALQVYLCSTGAACLLVNAGSIWRRWKHSSEATRAIAELLFFMGLPLKRQLLTKVLLCVAAGVTFLLDLATIPLFQAFNVEPVPESAAVT